MAGSQATGPAEERSEGASAPLRFGGIQRRQLCVMFVDLAGSTELAARLDLEDTRDLLLGFLEAAAARIEAAHGYVARYMGDGLLAYFGYPEARAEAAELALHAALEVQRAVTGLRTPDGTPLAARVGIATGEVMIGDLVGRGLAAECMVVGAAANLAARLQSAAAPGAVLACATTCELAGPGFMTEPTEPLSLKGFSEGVIAMQVSGLRESERFGEWQGRLIAPLAGRETELARLQSALGKARHGAQRLLICGEAGIGKSRLLHALRESAELPPERWLTTSGAASAEATPYYGLGKLLRRRIATTVDANPADGAVTGHELPAQPNLPNENLLRLALVAGLPIGPVAMPAPAPGELRSLLVEDCLVLLSGIAKNGPLVLAIEDAHWLDGSTRQLLADLLPRLGELPVLIIATSRLADDPLFTEAEVIELGELEPEALAELARHATGGLLDPVLIEQVIGRAQGVPLFAEELARLLLQSAPGARASIPATLADLLMSRLGRSEHGLAVAQLAALLGEDASPDALAALAGFDSATLARALDRLEIDGVTVPRGDPSAPVALRHALFGEAALAAMPAKIRRTAHLAAARLLVEREAPADRIARQFDSGSDSAHAAQWWQRAGDLARRRHALPEACGAYERAIELIDDEAAAMLPLLTAHFEVLQLRDGYSASTTKLAGEHLRERVEAQGDLNEQLLAIAGQWAVASSAGEYDLANSHAARAPAIAHVVGTSDALAAAAMIQLTARYRCGDLAGAEDAFRRGEPYFDDPIFAGRLGSIGQTYSNGAIIAWLLGDATAVAERLAVLEAAPNVHSDAYSRAFLAQGAAMILILNGDLARAEQAATTSLELAEQHGFPQFQMSARIALGAARAGREDPPAGVMLLREGLAKADEVGARAHITLFHAWLAEAELAAGMPDYALGTVTKGLSICPEERYAVPELIRLRAHAEHALGRSARRTPLLRDALAAADRIGAGAWRQKILTDLG